MRAFDMRRWTILLGGLGLCLVMAAASDARPRHRVIPADVRRFADRVEQCNHWAGEEAYDADRRRQINQAFDRLRCDLLQRDAARLRRRHAGDRASLALLVVPD